MKSTCDGRIRNGSGFLNSAEVTKLTFTESYFLIAIMIHFCVFQIPVVRFG